MNKKYNFSKFINFIRKIDGDLNDVDNQYFIDMLYDDTSNENKEIFSERYYSDYDLFNEYMCEIFANRRKLVTINIETHKFLKDTINVNIGINNEPELVMNISKSIYEQKIKNWLAFN